MESSAHKPYNLKAMASASGAKYLSRKVETSVAKSFQSALKHPTPSRRGITDLSEILMKDESSKNDAGNQQNSSLSKKGSPTYKSQEEQDKVTYDTAAGKNSPNPKR